MEKHQKKLRRLSRSELIELLELMSDDAEALHKENTTLRHELEENNLKISEIRSIAEASLTLTDIFQQRRNLLIYIYPLQEN